MISGLDAPTTFAFLPDGRVLVCEQNSGKILVIVNGHVAATQPAVTVSGISTGNERGLLGIAVDPRWPSVPWVYANYTRNTGTQCIIRYIASGDLTSPNGENLTLGSGLVLIDDIADAAMNHNAGCLRFGPDGCLYVALGDDGDFCGASDTTSLRGQILRLRVTTLPGGSGAQVARSVITPPDNPYVNSANLNTRLVHSFGYRNPFRFHIDPVTGTLIVGDVGDSNQEEMALANSGDFMGWPWLEGNFTRTRPTCPEPGGVGAMNSENAIWVVPHDEAVSYAIISAGRYRPVAGGTNNWAAGYNGDVFFGQYYQGYLRRLRFNGTGWVPAAAVPGQPNSTDWATGLVASTDFLTGPDGSLWWLAQFAPNFTSYSGSLHRIVSTTTTAVLPGASEAAALRASPNPFRESVEFAFRQPAAGRLQVVIHDLSGRRVRAVFTGEMAAGDHQLRWDGRDERGRDAGPGVYFARVERAGEAAVTARVLRVR